MLLSINFKNKCVFNLVLCTLIDWSVLPNNTILEVFYKLATGVQTQYIFKNLIGEQSVICSGRGLRGWSTPFSPIPLRKTILYTLLIVTWCSKWNRPVGIRTLAIYKHRHSMQPYIQRVSKKWCKWKCAFVSNKRLIFVTVFYMIFKVKVALKYSFFRRICLCQSWDMPD